MYIVYDTNDTISTLRSKYLVLELDTLEFSDGDSVKTFAVIDSEHVSFQEIGLLESLKDLHANLIKQYRLQDWSYCDQAIDNLLGSFKGELDTFYEELAKRIGMLKVATIADDWTGNIQAKEQPDQTVHSE